MRYIALTITCLFFLSCNEKIVQLPETENKKITEVLDVSPAYIFYYEEQDSVEFNRKNLISTTNWLVNVDKRLTLNQVMPHITFLQDKRKKAGMHKNAAARNYFSCSNPEIQNLAFIDFTDIEYELVQKSIIDAQNINSDAFIFDSERVEIVIDNQSIEATASTFIDSLTPHIASLNKDETRILLAFDENLTFQDYIKYKTLLLSLEVELTNNSNTELIYK